MSITRRERNSPPITFKNGWFGPETHHLVSINQHMGQQCQIRHHTTAQKIKYNVPKQETYPRNTASLNGATGAVSIQPCRFFDADPRKRNKLWRTCKEELFLRKRESKYGILKDVLLAPCRDRRCPSSWAGTYLEQTKQGGNKLHTLPKFIHASWILEHTLPNVLLPVFDKKF